MSDRASSGGSTSRSLVMKLRADRPDAWQRLVALYSPLVAHWCRKLDIPSQDVTDVSQEVFRAVAANVGRFRRDRPGDSFRGWLRTITRSKAMDYYRARADQPVAEGGTAMLRRLSDEPDAFGDADEVEEKPLRDAVFHRALEFIRREFHDQTWQAFWKVIVDEKTPKEAAEELSMTPGAVRVAKCRVLQRLRRELGELIDLPVPESRGE